MCADPAPLDLSSEIDWFTVIDVPRSNIIALDALDSATKIVLVVNEEPASVRTGHGWPPLWQRYGESRLPLVLTCTIAPPRSRIRTSAGRSASTSRHLPNDYRRRPGDEQTRPLVLDANHDLSKAFTAFARLLANMSSVAPKAEKARSEVMFRPLGPRKGEPPQDENQQAMALWPTHARPTIHWKRKTPCAHNEHRTPSRACACQTTSGEEKRVERPARVPLRRGSRSAMR